MRIILLLPIVFLDVYIEGRFVFYSVFYEDSGNLFLIRGKSNTAGSIRKAVSDEFTEIEEYKGLKVNQLPQGANADLQIKTQKGNSIRVVIRHHQHNDDSCSIIRTNIPKERLCAKQVYLL